MILSLTPHARVTRLVRRLARRDRLEERGQAMVEYALTIGLVTVVSLVSLGAVGGAAAGVYGAVSAALAAAPGA
jgi:Flp pilus assembly pilin Flp